MLGISRRVLDAHLLEAARSAGATLLQPVRCEKLGSPCDCENHEHVGRVALRFRNLRTNEVTDEAASLVLLADGKSALMEDSPSPSGDFGIKSHWMGLSSPRDAIELFACAGCYGGFAPIEGDRWNAAFSVPSARLKACGGDLNLLFDQLTAENIALRHRRKTAIRVSDWLAAPLPRFSVRKDWPTRVIPIGNAAAAIEPIGGEGMGLALRSAELAATALLLRGECWGAADQRKLQQDYQRLWRMRRAACRAGGWVASSEILSEAVLPLLAQNGAVLRRVMRAVGK
jgi:2-polyprenyl-6-methoxyphenol hydroxylase-like FAD-dependent oxidoreductase